MMCSARVRLIRSTSAASVVLLPLPVAPVTSTRPRDSAESDTTEGGRPSASSVGMSSGMRRIETAIVPRWRNTLARTRPTPGACHAMSTSSLVWSCTWCAGDRSRAAMPSRAAALTGATLVQRWSDPSTRTRGTCSARRWMSEAPWALAACTIWSNVMRGPPAGGTCPATCDRVQEPCREEREAIEEPALEQGQSGDEKCKPDRVPPPSGEGWSVRYRPVPAPTAAAFGMCTGVSQPCLSGTTPSM